jgi:hypothetical protein
MAKIEQTHYWTEPVKENQKWHVNKCSMDGKTIGTSTFHSEPEALRFLKEINIYIDGKLMLTSSK